MVGAPVAATGTDNKRHALRCGIYLSILTLPVMNAVATALAFTGNSAMRAEPAAVDFKTRLSLVEKVLSAETVSVPVSESIPINCTLFAMLRFRILFPSNTASGISCSVMPLNSMVPRATSNLPRFCIAPAIFNVPVTVTEAPPSMVMLCISCVLVITGYLSKPDGIVRSLLAVGIPPHDQLPALFQTVSMAPVQSPAVPMLMSAVVMNWLQSPEAATVYITV